LAIDDGPWTIDDPRLVIGNKSVTANKKLLSKNKNITLLKKDR
jgi:hypothetical protein